MARRNTKSQVTKAEATLRKQRAMELRVAGLTCAQIGAELGVHETTAAAYVREALAESAAAKLENADHLRELELERLDKLQRAAERVLAKHHVYVNAGKVVMDVDMKTGELYRLEDDGPVLAAIDRLVKIGESRRKLLGIDAPAKTEQSGELRVVVEYVDVDADGPPAAS